MTELHLSGVEGESWCSQKGLKEEELTDLYDRITCPLCVIAFEEFTQDELGFAFSANFCTDDKGKLLVKVNKGEVSLGA